MNSPSHADADPGLGSRGNLSRMGDEAPEDGASHHELKMVIPVPEVKGGTLDRIHRVKD